MQLTYPGESNEKPSSLALCNIGEVKKLCSQKTNKWPREHAALTEINEPEVLLLVWCLWRRACVSVGCVVRRLSAEMRRRPFHQMTPKASIPPRMFYCSFAWKWTSNKKLCCWWDKWWRAATQKLPALKIALSVGAKYHQGANRRGSNYARWRDVELFELRIQGSCNRCDAKLRIFV